jgi:hypothetical protein
MGLQAYIDDSYDGDLFVLAGHVAPAESWSQFKRNWEFLLPTGTLNKYNRYHFKMVEMAQSEERMARFIPFYRVIEFFVPLSVSISLRPADLEIASGRLWVPGVGNPIEYEGFRHLKNKYIVAFFTLMDAFHRDRAKFKQQIPEESPVDFFFDEQAEKKLILSGWDTFLAADRRAESRHLYGNKPRFENDEEFLPLQAADLWAWWIREWVVDFYVRSGGRPTMPFKIGDFGRWGKSSGRVATAHYHYGLDQITDLFRRCIRKQAPAGTRIYDVRFNGL